MNNQNNKTAQKAIKNIDNFPLRLNSAASICLAWLVIFSVFVISKVNADVLDNPRSNISYGLLSQTVDDQTRLDIIKKNYASLVSDQTTGKATGKSRDEINQTTADSLLQPTNRSYSTEFTIYDAFTMLRNDFDYDGYYQTFSLVFDADLYSYDGNAVGAVYARLYISENGGPWYHYYTTDDFIIRGESADDEYEVITTFRQGYYPSHYDLLIDLYEVGSDSLVATYSSDDNESLYSLPLESSDYDEYYVDGVEVQYGGSLSIWSLILLVLLLTSRLYHGTQTRR